MTSKLDLGLFIGSIGGGGAQRIVCLLANAWAADGHRVTIYHNDHNNDAFPFPKAEAVRLVHLPIALPAANRLVARARFFKDILTIRRTILKAGHDLFISFLPQPNVMALLARIGTRIPVIITEWCHPEHDIQSGYWQFLRKVTYPHADAFVVQTTDVHAWFQQNLGLSPTVIPNPVPPAGGEKKPQDPAGRKIILAASRLIYQKNLSSLVNAFAMLAERHPDWDVHIYGIGDEQQMLEELIARHALADRVLLLGWTGELSRRLSEAEMFALPSRFEGMPMALAEAMAMGVPCVATDCPSGPADYIRSGENGLLVPVEDVDALAAAMDTLMSDAQARARMGRNATSILQRFSLEAVLKAWDRCLSDVAGRP